MVTHWDDVAGEPVAHGDIRCTRWRLGRAAGSVRVGLSRWLVEAGARNAPVHVHGDEEELAFVLAGSGVSWEDGVAHPVRPGDALLYPAKGPPHTLVGELDVLLFGSGSDSGLTWLPRAGTMWAGPRWLPGDVSHPFAAEAAAGPLPAGSPGAERPSSIVALGDVPAEPTRRGRTDMVRRKLGEALGSARSGLRHVTIAPGAESFPPHCHSAEEELFVVLGGTGAVRLGEETHAVRRGSVVARPAGTGVAHAFEAGDEGLELLAYGRRDPADVCFYPRSGKLSVRGVGAVFRVERVDYWDGEE